MKRASIVLLAVASAGLFVCIAVAQEGTHSSRPLEKAGDGGSAGAMAATDTALARLYFERFRGLSGAWQAKSTRGWEETSNWKTIAGGSVVMETSFDAHPGETMVTMFTLDQGRLVLDHYCVAGNQPHLVASQMAPDGHEVTFTFERGGNLESRDRGHMDKAVYRFLDNGRYTTQWTWFSKGKEQWMEQIEAKLVK